MEIFAELLDDIDRHMRVYPHWLRRFAWALMRAALVVAIWRGHGHI